MWTTMLMGLRNIRRRMTRSILTIGMLAAGTLLLVFMVGMNEGPYADMIRMATSTWNGQFQVLHHRYKDSPSLFETVDNPDAIMARLEGHPDVVQVTARIESAGLFSVDARTAGGVLHGVLPDRERKVSSLSNTLKAGSFLGATRDSEALPIVLGDGLAERLKVKLGGEVIYLGQAADGSIAAEAFELVGILDSGIDDLDASMAIVRLDHAQELFVLGSRVHRIVGRSTSSYTVDGLKADLPVDAPLAFYTWSDLMPEVSRGIEQDREGGHIFVFVIMLMVLLGTVNTLLMSVFERTKEFGVMKALGTPRYQIVAVVLWEGTWLSILGVGLGVLLGTLLVIYFGIDGIAMLDEPIDFAGMKLHKIYPRNTVLGNVVYPLSIVVASIVGSAWPAWRASKLDPVAALREL